MSARTGHLPGYTRLDGHDIAQVAPQMLSHDGKRFLVVHAAGFTTGLLCNPGQSPDEGRIVLTTWCDPPQPGSIGTALSFTPDDDMLDMIIGSLTHFRDSKRASAAAAAGAALARARGK